MTYSPSQKWSFTSLHACGQETICLMHMGQLQDDHRTNGHTNPGNYGSTEAGLGITYRGGRAGSGQEELVESSQGHEVKGLEDADM